MAKIEEAGDYQAEYEREYAQGAIPFFPNHLLKEVIAAYLVFGLLLVVIALFPIELQPKADPVKTPAHIKPEWYFLPMYQFLKLPFFRPLGEAGRSLSVIIQGLVFAVLFFLPFLDGGEERGLRKRLFFIVLGTLGIIVITGLAVWGHYS